MTFANVALFSFIAASKAITELGYLKANPTKVGHILLHFTDSPKNSMAKYEWIANLVPNNPIVKGLLEGSFNIE